MGAGVDDGGWGAGVTTGAGVVSVGATTGAGVLIVGATTGEGVGGETGGSKMVPMKSGSETTSPLDAVVMEHVSSVSSSSAVMRCPMLVDPAMIDPSRLQMKLWGMCLEESTSQMSQDPVPCPQGDRITIPDVESTGGWVGGGARTGAGVGRGAGALGVGAEPIRRARLRLSRLSPQRRSCPSSTS